jgi:hypothetical protein
VIGQRGFELPARADIAASTPPTRAIRKPLARSTA